VVIGTPIDGINSPGDLHGFGYNYDMITDKWSVTDTACDFVYLKHDQFITEFPGSLGIICDFETWRTADGSFKERAYPLLDLKQFTEHPERAKRCNFLRIDVAEIDDTVLGAISGQNNLVLILETGQTSRRASLRNAILRIQEAGVDHPVIVRISSNTDSLDQLRLESATDVGALLLDGLGDGVWLEAPAISAAEVNIVAFGILQATRMRITRTEYIACPSCGRTLFDLQSTTERIRNRTQHLKGVKIGIMGCIVNGPGEMADADYGYVGSGPGKITLYRGQEIVTKAIPSADAVDALIDLIREDGNWVEPGD
jgi:(E)-4-hydroxy-3-methylbut-2-enyl-diphosphate synthase